MENVPLVILAGGLGTRLREETEFRPKPMIEIGGMPIIWHIMKYYSSWGVNEFIICTGYKGEIIKNYFLNYGVIQNDITVKTGAKSTLQIHQEQNDDWKITIVDTGPLTPTGGRIFKIQKYIETDFFYCTYGDGLANIDIEELTRVHLKTKALATLTAVKPMSRFGVLDIDENKNVVQFREKPRMDSWINGGYFVFNRQIFNRLSADSILEEDPLSGLTRNGKLSAYQHEGFWQPMDTYREAQFLNSLWEKNMADWKIW